MIKWHLPYAHKIDEKERLKWFSYFRSIRDDVKFFQVHTNSTVTEISLNLYAYQLLNASQCDLWYLQREYETLKNKYIEKSKEVTQLKKQRG